MGFRDLRENPSRDELFDLVWSKPTTEVARNLGISDVAVGKLCSKLQVPKPPRGYWARLEAGQTPQKPPLRAFREENEKKPKKKRLAGTKLSPRRLELFLAAARDAAGANAHDQPYHLKGDVLTRIDPIFAGTVISLAGNRYLDYLDPEPKTQSQRAAFDTVRALIDLLLPLAAERVVILKRPPRSEWETDDPETIVIRLSDQLIREIADMRRLVIDKQLSFASKALGYPDFARRLRYPHSSNRYLAATTELCVSRQEIWARSNDAWNGESFETERLSLATIGPIELTSGPEVVLPSELKHAFFSPYLDEMRSAEEAEQACDIAEARVSSMAAEETKKALGEVLKLYWPPGKLQLLEDAYEVMQEAEREIDEWRQSIEARKQRLAERILGFRLGDIISGYSVGRPITVEAGHVTFSLYEDKVIFVVSGRRMKKDGLPGKRSEAVYLSAKI